MWQMIKKNWIIPSFFIFLLCTAPSKILATSENRTFYNINDLYDLSLFGANSVCKDHQGFIWISSKTGVIRLAGDDAGKYVLPYISADIITVDLEYADSTLIAYTNNGQFFRFNPVKDEFEVIFDMRRLLNNTHVVVNNLLIGENGTFYIASSAGLYKYKDKTFSLVLDEDREANYIEWLDEQHIFVAGNHGIWMYNLKTSELECLFENDSFNSLMVTTLFYDKREEKLWIGTNSNGLFLYDFQKKTFGASKIPDLPHNPILDMEIISDSTLMLGVDGQGLWEIGRADDRVLDVYTEDVNNPNSLQGNGVYDIFKDENQRVWICTYSGGVSFFDQSMPIVTQIKHRINEKNSLVNNNVNDIYEDRNGNIWFATNNGISRWNPESNRWQDFYHNEKGQAIVFLAVNEGGDGTVWAGSFSKGVYVLDEKTGQEIARYSSKEGQSGVTGDFVFDILKDTLDDLWIVGVLENVTRYNTQKNEFERLMAVPAYLIEDFTENSKLLGCTYGLVLLNKEDKTTETLLDGYIIQDIQVDGNIIWCATSGDGLIRYDYNTKESKKYTINEGLPSNFVNIVTKSAGFLWLGTENGLCRFSIAEEKALTYASILSLSNVSFNQDAVATLHNGDLIMGTNRGAVMFDPLAIEVPELSGNIFLQDIIVSGRTIRDSAVYDLKTPLNKLQKITLPHNQNTISIELLPVGVSLSETKFSWKFEGIDQDWSAPIESRILTYANLPGGEFDLRIRLYNNSVTQIIDERLLRVEIIPPFWTAWWFYALVILLFAGVLYFVLRYHINLIRQLHSEEKIRYFANTAHEIRTSLTLIKGPVEEIDKETDLSQKGKYFLNLAKEQMSHLLKVTNQLLDFQKFDKGKGQLHLKVVNIVDLIEQRKIMFDSYAQKQGVVLEYEYDVADCFSAVDVGMMEKVLDNLIANAIKYSKKDGKVSLRFGCNTRNWVFEIEDKGIGISQKGQRKLFKEFYRSENAVNSEIVGSGIGLLMVKNYVEKHGGTISFESKQDIGSVFKIQVPLKELKKESEKPEAIIERPETLLPTNESTNPVKKEVVKHSDFSILIVEDNEKLRHFLEVVLSEKFIVSTAKDGAEAWELVQKTVPGLVISDIMMPEMDGFELCRLLKSTYETSHIPVVLLTSLTDKTRQIQGLGLGADAYLTKPFDPDLLISRINSILSNRKTIRDKALRLIDHERSAPIMDNELNDRFVKKALEVVRDNIANPRFGKDEFAFEMNASASLLYKKIKALTDQSPSDFIKSVRLNYALELLQTRKFTVTEVSEKVGFSSVGYFSTVFKKFYRKSPTEILSLKK